jgi:hypothetical protein
MELSQAQYLSKLSDEAIKLHEMIRKSTSILRWVTNKTKKKCTGWRVVIEPRGIDYSYRNSISIDLPRDMGIKEIRALAQAMKKEGLQRLKGINCPTKKELNALSSVNQS